MRRFIPIVVCLVLFVMLVACDAQVTREIPLRYANAAELASLFGGERLRSEPAAQPFESFLQRCLTNALSDLPAQAWRWQTWLETDPTSDFGAADYNASLKSLLPHGLGVAPKAILERNALSVTGTAEDIMRLTEIIDLLDRPAKWVNLQVTLLKIAPDAVAALPGVDWNYPADENHRRLGGVACFAHGRFADLFQAGATDPNSVSATLTAANNSAIEMRAAEVLPCYVAGGAGAAAPRYYLRALRLALQPRINADNSVTVLWRSQYVPGMSGDGMAATSAVPPAAKAEVVVQTQCRIAPGDTLLLAGLGSDTSPEAQQYDRYGPNRLSQPLVAITPFITQPPADAAAQ